jgi:CHAD domain-containing protein
VIAYLDGDAYVRLAAALIDLLKTGLDAPSTSSKRLIVHELKRTRKRIRHLKLQEPGTVAEFGALHETRKSARHVRYVAEAIAANGMKHQSRYLTVAAAAELVQDTIGDHRDRILLAEFLLFESKRAHAASEDTFALGAAHREILRSAADAHAASEHAIKGLKRTRRDW